MKSIIKTSQPEVGHGIAIFDPTIAKLASTLSRISAHKILVRFSCNNLAIILKDSNDKQKVSRTD